jgi:hypothetical protein
MHTMRTNAMAKGDGHHTYRFHRSATRLGQRITKTGKYRRLKDLQIMSARIIRCSYLRRQAMLGTQPLTTRQPRKISWAQMYGSNIKNPFSCQRASLAYLRRHDQFQKRSREEYWSNKVPARGTTAPIRSCGCCRCGRCGRLHLIGQPAA